MRSCGGFLGDEIQPDCVNGLDFVFGFVGVLHFHAVDTTGLVVEDFAKVTVADRKILPKRWPERKSQKTTPLSCHNIHFTILHSFQT